MYALYERALTATALQFANRSKHAGGGMENLGVPVRPRLRWQVLELGAPGGNYLIWTVPPQKSLPDRRFHDPPESQTQ